MAMTDERKASLTTPTDDRILITRRFDAPRHLVFRAWTTPELVARWWTARRGTAKEMEIDLRVGGRWRYSMETPDGQEVAFHGEYREIVPNERIVTTEVYEGAPLPPEELEANATLKFFVDFCHSHGMASSAYLGFGTDVVNEVTKLCETINNEYPSSIFLTSKLIFEHDNWFTRLLHNQAALAIQRRLHFESLQMVILPMKV